MNKIKALVCTSLSEDFSGTSIKLLDLPNIGINDLLIEVKASSINFPDLLMSQGKYQHKPDLPFVLGMEGAGVIKEVGSLVTKFKKGDEVCFGSWGNGAFAEYLIVPEDNANLKPKNFNFVQAASFQTAYLTAYVALVRLGKLTKNETLLVHGASGGVGMAAVQLGKLLGAKIIATGSSKEKLNKCLEWGASHIIEINKEKTPEFRKEVKELTNGNGADVIFDPVGGDIFDQSLRCINWGGRILIIGFTSGRIPQVPVNIPLIKGFSVIGVRAGEYGRRDPIKGQENIEAIYKIAENGDFNPYICKSFNLEDGIKALQYMKDRKIIGKTVIQM